MKDRKNIKLQQQQKNIHCISSLFFRLKYKMNFNLLLPLDSLNSFQNFNINVYVVFTVLFGKFVTNVNPIHYNYFYVHTQLLWFDVMSSVKKERPKSLFIYLKIYLKL